jgi:hypothetical protein
MKRIDRDLIKEKGIIPKLRLGIKGERGVVSAGPKRVKFIAVKAVNGTDPITGKDTEYFRYLFEENGEKKYYQTKKLNKEGDISYLVQRLADVNDGDEIILEMKKRGPKNYIDVLPVSHTTSVEVDEEEDSEESDGLEDFKIEDIQA